jgi:hypothetical protein
MLANLSENIGSPTAGFYTKAAKIAKNQSFADCALKLRRFENVHRSNRSKIRNSCRQVFAEDFRQPGLVEPLFGDADHGVVELVVRDCRCGNSVELEKSQRAGDGCALLPSRNGWFWAMWKA